MNSLTALDLVESEGRPSRPAEELSARAALTSGRRSSRTRTSCSSPTRTSTVWHHATGAAPTRISNAGAQPERDRRGAAGGSAKGVIRSSVMRRPSRPGARILAWIAVLLLGAHASALADSAAASPRSVVITRPPLVEWITESPPVSLRYEVSGITPEMDRGRVRFPLPPALPHLFVAGVDKRDAYLCVDIRASHGRYEAQFPVQVPAGYGGLLRVDFDSAPQARRMFSDGRAAIDDVAILVHSASSATCGPLGTVLPASWSPPRNVDRMRMFVSSMGATAVEIRVAGGPPTPCLSLHDLSKQKDDAVVYDKRCDLAVPANVACGADFSLAILRSDSGTYRQPPSTIQVRRPCADGGEMRLSAGKQAGQ